MGEPVRSWTPPERWLFEALAREALVVVADGGPSSVDGPERVMLWTAGGVMTLPLPAGPVRVILAPRAVWGHPWRERLMLEVVRGEARGVLHLGARELRLDGEGDAIVTMRARALEIDGAHPVPLVDAALEKHTRQSSAPDIGPSEIVQFMWPTLPEREPWWEVDLGAPMYLHRLHAWLPPLPEGTTVTVVAYAYATPRGEVPEAAWRHDTQAGEIDIELATVARYVRIALSAPSDVILQLGGVELFAASLFAESLRATWRRAFALYRDRPLFSSGSFEEWTTYGEIGARVGRLADALAARLEPSEARVFVAICLRNSPEWVVADLAAIERGYVVVPLSPEDSPERLAELIERAGVHALFCEAELAPELARRCPSLRLVVTREEQAGLEGPPAAEASYPEDALYSLLFTSGSTGTPKGAMRSYGAFHSLLRIYGVTQPAIHLSFQPLSHLSERMQLPTVMLHGGRAGFSRGGAELMADMARLEPTMVFSVPRLYEALHGRFERALRRDPAREAELLAEHRLAFGRRVQSVSVGSAPCSPEVFAFLKRCFADVWVSEGYGSTEVGTIAVDGRIHDGVEVKLVAVPGHDPAGTPSRGEIWVRTPHHIGGYFGDESATTASFDADGFFHTGDLGERGADGSVRVIGRVKAAVKLAQGEFVSPDRIEAALASCPLVDRIYVHADARHGVGAAVVPAAAASSEELRRALAAHGREAGLASYEIPAAVLVVAEQMTVENGLLTASGKLRRAEAAKRFAPALAALVEEVPRAHDGSLLGRLGALASEILGKPVDPDAPLADGVAIDSLGAAEVLRAFGSEVGREIPLAAWFEAATLRGLVARLESPAVDRNLLASADRALPLPSFGAPAAHCPPRTILLTGATGLLGSHLLEALSGVRVLCLVRGADGAARLRSVLAGYEIAAEYAVVRGDLGEPRLGLDDATWRRLAGEVDAIVHAGAEVSWLARYEHVRAANVLGTHALLELAAAEREKPFHFVSTISTAPADGDETSMLSFGDASSGSPYALSKWIAEELIRRAGAAGLPVTIHRPAMITGHSRRGHGNPDDYVHRYLRGCSEIGLHLDLPDRLDMTPVDYVAGAVAALALEPPGGETYHLCNIDQSLGYRDLGDALRAAGISCAPAPYAEFRRRAVRDSPSLKPLASYFPPAGFALTMGPWPSMRSKEALAARGIRCPPVDERLVATSVASLRRRGAIR
jgi:fatty acid CoA ligase FadD9